MGIVGKAFIASSFFSLTIPVGLVSDHHYHFPLPLPPTLLRGEDFPPIIWTCSPFLPHPSCYEGIRRKNEGRRDLSPEQDPHFSLPSPLSACLDGAPNFDSPFLNIVIGHMLPDGSGLEVQLQKSLQPTTQLAWSSSKHR